MESLFRRSRRSGGRGSKYCWPVLTIGPALNVPDTVSRLWPANALRRLQVLLNVVYVGWTGTLPSIIAIAPVAAAAQEIARLQNAALGRAKMLYAAAIES
jgi:hypothetical protein